MGKILFRYVIKEVLGSFILGVFIFTFVVLMFQILKLAEIVVNHGVGLLEVGKLFAFTLPPLFVLTIPMAFLLAVMLAMSRLSADSEFTAMKAGGISLIQFLPPVSILAAGTTLICFALTLYAEPWGKQSVKTMLYDLGKNISTLKLSERVFNDEFDGLVLYVNEISSDSKTLKGIFISDDRKPEASNIIIASEAILEADPDEAKLTLRLKDGSIHRTQERADVYETARFRQYDVLLDFAKLIDQSAMETTYLEMGIGQLRAHIKKLKETEGDTYDMRRAWVEYHRRFAFPFACFIFALVGLPLGIAPPRSGKSRGFTFAVLVLCLYYLLFRAGENIGWKGIVHPIVVMWAPNVILGVFGFWMLIKKTNETPIRSFEWAAEMVDKATTWLKAKLFKNAISDREGRQ